MKTLGASIAIWRGEEYDFCWRQCIQSVLPFCEQVVVAYIPSEDGTVEALNEWAAREPKLKLVLYPKPVPDNDGLWVMDWTNFAREKLNTDYNLQMDADEVLHEDSGQKILDRIQGSDVTLRCRRWNFWKDAQHLVPNGVCLASEVLRVSPKRHWLPADVPLPQGQDAMNLDTPALDIELFHYGFLRKRDAYFKKERGLQVAFTGGYDPKLDVAEKTEGNWMETPEYSEWQNRVTEFKGRHPAMMHDWLLVRGFHA